MDSTSRNPVDRIGGWYGGMALWKRLGLLVLAPEAVVGCWIVYQLKRGWIGSDT
jgi:hypothetical protein